VTIGHVKELFDRISFERQDRNMIQGGMKQA